VRNIIVGTAGHIDHGKTSLVRALTGIDTDRLEEEKRRGISIDLGFAHLDLDGEVRLGLVDVPGHERFIKNMLAGVGGIDVVMLVVAADESIKPQTREHFEICRLLQVPRGLVVLTKVDLVDDDLLGLVRLEVEEFVAGSFLEGAPLVPVSTTTGAGLDELKRQLKQLAKAVTPKDSSRRPRLPIDRCFSLRGFGTVVTGTLLSGQMAAEDELEAYPTGRRVRVRGLQVHGQAAPRACAGQRTAVNLTGAEPHDLRRGLMLAEPGLFQPTTMLDAAFDLLPGALPLKHGAPVHFHAGTAEVEASVRLLESAEPMRPGTRAYVRFQLAEPLLLWPGDRFIVRMFSPVVTIGGGTVREIAPPLRMRRADVVARLRAVDGGARSRLERYVQESAWGVGLADLVARTGWLEADLRTAAPATAIVFEQPHWWAVDRAWAEARLQAMRRRVAEHHRQQPLQPGLSKEELRSRELAGAPAHLLDNLLALTRDLVAEGDVVRATTHQVRLQQDEEAAVAKIEQAFATAGLAVPATSEVLRQSGVEPARARSLLQLLLKRRALIKIGDELVFHAPALDGLRQQLQQRKGARFGVAEFKDWTGVSRKYAIPLLEYFDRERVTRREGDQRLVL
jgi:selenocysteine-specific elongation factor